jgi:hypothetical protein
MQLALLRVLESQQKLPVIVFNFDRTLCEDFCLALDYHMR